jgi:hypothetical protein
MSTKKSTKNSAKKAILKKIVKSKKKGLSPFKMDNGLGKTPLIANTIGSGGGSNLGTNGIF